MPYLQTYQGFKASDPPGGGCYNRGLGVFEPGMRRTPSPPAPLAVAARGAAAGRPRLGHSALPLPAQGTAQLRQPRRHRLRREAGRRLDPHRPGHHRQLRDARSSPRTTAVVKSAGYSDRLRQLRRPRRDGNPLRLRLRPHEGPLAGRRRQAGARRASASARSARPGRTAASATSTSSSGRAAGSPAAAAPTRFPTCAPGTSTRAARSRRSRSRRRASTRSSKRLFYDSAE